jgi:hypothetical protein
MSQPLPAPQRSGVASRLLHNSVLAGLALSGRGLWWFMGW